MADIGSKRKAQDDGNPESKRSKHEDHDGEYQMAEEDAIKELLTTLLSDAGGEVIEFLCGEGHWDPDNILLTISTGSCPMVHGTSVNTPRHSAFYNTFQLYVPWCDEMWPRIMACPDGACLNDLIYSTIPVKYQYVRNKWTMRLIYVQRPIGVVNTETIETNIDRDWHKYGPILSLFHDLKEFTTIRDPEELLSRPRLQKLRMSHSNVMLRSFLVMH